MTDLTNRLVEGFETPPQEAKPHIWWHWIGGNITKEGIASDLDWMAEIGLGGIQAFTAERDIPVIVDEPRPFMGDAWKEAFDYAAQLADERGLDLAIPSSPGWSETGGPWVKPENGMKKLVWSETIVSGAEGFDGQLAAPPSVTGPYQSIEVGESEHPIVALRPLPEFYEDVSVLAVRVLHSPLDDAPSVTSGGQALDAADLTDDDDTTAASIDRGSFANPTVLEINYDEEVTVRSIQHHITNKVALYSNPLVRPVLEALTADGWQKVADLAISDLPSTTSFAEVTASQFRVVFNAPMTTNEVGSDFGGQVPTPDDPIHVNTLRLGSEARVDRVEAKAGFTIANDYHALNGLAPETEGVALEDVIDLTHLVKEDGSLSWTPPDEGEWRILRMGYSLTGSGNGPAVPEASGLEVDKFDADAVRTYLKDYLALYEDTLGGDLTGAGGLDAFLTDSIETFPANWTPQLIEKFKELRGYDPTPWLPVLAGVIIGDRAASDAFLYDFRETLANLLASEHYGTVADVAKELGLTYYGEALEQQRPLLGDDMEMRSHAEIPMGALWSWKGDVGPRTTFLGDLKGAASVANIYGKDYVAAEALTTGDDPWGWAPSDLRQVIDVAFAYGVNRPVIHSTVHQPLEEAPSLSLGHYGQFFSRHETWADMAGPWIDYMSRSSYLLQQGRNVADIAVFYGEEAPLVTLYNDGIPEGTPAAHAFDYVNAEALLEEFSVKDGAIVTTGGARYEVLHLGGTSQYMTLPVLEKIAALVEAGGTVVGTAPIGSPSLSNDPLRYQELVELLWGGGEVTGFGAGRMVASDDPEAVLAAMEVAPGFSIAGGAPDPDLLFLEREVEDGSIFYLANTASEAKSFEASFRVCGKVPMLFHADTGEVEAVSYRIDGDYTYVPLEIDPKDSVFVVFTEEAAATEAFIAETQYAHLGDIEGAWRVEFEEGRGAPEAIMLDELTSLSEHPDAGVKYFSGVASYQTTFELPVSAAAGEALWLDFDEVADIAEVWVNGAHVDTLWQGDYRTDIGAAVQDGVNTLEVRVANLWVNRLIGDAQPGAEKVATTHIDTYAADAPLLNSGLIGSVSLYAELEELRGTAGEDRLVGGRAHEHLLGLDGDDLLLGRAGDDLLEGGAGDDRLHGGAGDDQVHGGAGNDRVEGGKGDDLLDGGAGQDVLTGGAGRDVFVFASASDAGLGRSRDKIADFERGEDLIRLDFDADVTLEGDQGFDFIGRDRFGGEAGELRFCAGVLAGDLDGDGAADFEIALRGVDKLSASEFADAIL